MCHILIHSRNSTVGTSVRLLFRHPHQRRAHGNVAKLRISSLQLSLLALHSLEKKSIVDVTLNEKISS